MSSANGSPQNHQGRGDVATLRHVSTAPFQRARSDLVLPVERSTVSSGQPPQVPNGMRPRRLSMPYNKPVRGRYEEKRIDQIKTQRYERMMDHFQLRRVVLHRSLSNGSSTAASTTQRDTFLTTQRDTFHGTAPHTSMAAYEATLLPPPTLEEDAASESTNAVVTPFGRRLSFAARVLSKMTLEAFMPTGVAAQGRLAMVVVTIIVQLIYLPFAVVYGHIDSSLPRACMRYDAFVDVTFVLSIVVQCNTATYTSRGQVVSSRRAIWRHYRHHGFPLDAATAIPLGLVFQRPTDVSVTIVFVQMLVRSLVVYHQFEGFRLLWTKSAIDTKKTRLDWLLYSRYGHLLRVGRLVVVIAVLSHYLACVWSLLTLESDFSADNRTSTGARGTISLHLHSIYDVLQLLQGQGIGTTTTAQDVFGSCAVLLGSLALAVIFGHVAILVSNFSANQTNYQRKMESVFAVMEKLQLPNAIRDRVHQYYEYLHSEYESTDGDIVKFAKDLSRTLELEVVLFKYMDVVMHVPHWGECSPDFQKQLVLNLSVRVYLPDDFVLRRGEVGTSCYIINRGVCKQHEYANGNDEYPTPPLLGEASEGFRTDPRYKAGPSPTLYSGREAPMSDESGGAASDSDSRVTTLSRGQAFGELALITNYTRASDVRAFTYVEMCVLERDVFQRVLTRYPTDRELVLTRIMQHCMAKTKADSRECKVMKMVHAEAPGATEEEAVALMVRAMTPRASDPSIIFGITDKVTDGLKRAAQEARIPRGDAGNTDGDSADKVTSPPGNSAEVTWLVEMVQGLQAQLIRIERSLQPVASDPKASDEYGAAHGTAADPSNENGTRPPLARRPSQERVTEPRQQPTLRLSRTDAKVALMSTNVGRGRRQVRRASEASLSPSMGAPSHTQYADFLFQPTQ